MPDSVCRENPLTVCAAKIQTFNTLLGHTQVQVKVEVMPPASRLVQPHKGQHSRTQLLAPPPKGPVVAPH